MLNEALEQKLYNAAINEEFQCPISDSFKSYKRQELFKRRISELSVFLADKRSTRLRKNDDTQQIHLVCNVLKSYNSHIRSMIWASSTRNPESRLEVVREELEGHISDGSSMYKRQMESWISSTEVEEMSPQVPMPPPLSGSCCVLLRDDQFSQFVSKSSIILIQMGHIDSLTVSRGIDCYQSGGVLTCKRQYHIWWTWDHNVKSEQYMLTISSANQNGCSI
ncbi:hypothetical protein ACTXT7_015429 [Hymenolepis weldensis]